MYLQLDSYHLNKCDALVIACTSLVSVGIVKKIKGNFLEVGHAQGNIDVLIDSVVTTQHLMDLPTLEARVEAIMSALKKI